MGECERKEPEEGREKELGRETGISPENTQETRKKPGKERERERERDRQKKPVEGAR